MTPDPHYNSDCDLYLGIDKGFRNPNVPLWIQPDRKWERVIVLFAHYQVLRTPDENARIAMKIHEPKPASISHTGVTSAEEIILRLSRTIKRLLAENDRLKPENERLITRNNDGRPKARTCLMRT